jgi:hypothetical protein
MSGPFPESLWPKLYIELPDSADPSQFRKAVEAAVLIHRRDAAIAAKAPRWQRLIDAFDRVLAEVQAINDGLPAQIIVAVGAAEKQIPSQLPRSYDLNDVRASRDHAKYQLQLERALTDKRREQLYANLIVACVNVGGLRCSKSRTGPLPRALKAILDHALPNAGYRKEDDDYDKDLSDSGVRKIIERHVARGGSKVVLD